MSDNLDRAMKDLKITLDNLPSPAISVVLKAWKRRIEWIKQCSDYVNNTSPAAAREILVLRSCIKDIEAAHHIDKGNPVRALEILLSDD